MSIQPREIPLIIYWRDFDLHILSYTKQEDTVPAKMLNIDINDRVIPIIFEQDNRLPIVTMQLVFRNSGALSDEVSGVAKLASKLLSEGTKAEGSIAFATELESRAVSLGVSVGAETCVIVLSSLESEFEFAVSALCRLLDDPNYTAKTFTKIQTQTIGRLTQKQSDFDYVASAKLKSLLFAGTPRANPSSGTMQSVKSIELADLQRYVESHLGYDNLIAIVGGDLSEDDARAIVARVAGRLPKTELEDLPRLETISAPKEQIEIAKTEQSYIYFGAPYDMAFDSDEAYLGKVASFVLGSSGFGSRLMEEIRVSRGLAYSAYSSLNVSRTGSYLTGYLQTKLESTQEAKSVVSEVVSKFIRDGITQDELDSAKQFILGSEPLRQETLQQRVATAFSEYYDDRELGYKSQELEQIGDITLEQINSFIRSHTELSELSFAIVTAEG